MTQKDFELIAGTVAAIRDPATRKSVAYDFAVLLKGTNSKFNEARFIAACRLDDERGFSSPVRR